MNRNEGTMSDEEIDTLLEYYINRSSKDPYDSEDLIKVCLAIIEKQTQ